MGPYEVKKVNGLPFKEGVGYVSIIIRRLARCEVLMDSKGGHMLSYFDGFPILGRDLMAIVMRGHMFSYFDAFFLILGRD